MTIVTVTVPNRGSKVDTCPECHGTGQQRVVQNTPFGQMVNVRTCSHCGGTGKIIEKENARSATERVRFVCVKRLKVKIPAGIDDGQRLRIAGEGEPGVRGGGRGDLYVYIFVRKDPNFVRRGKRHYFAADHQLYSGSIGCYYSCRDYGW